MFMPSRRRPGSRTCDGLYSARFRLASDGLRIASSGVASRRTSRTRKTRLAPSRVARYAPRSRVASGEIPLGERPRRVASPSDRS